MKYTKSSPRPGEQSKQPLIVVKLGSSSVTGTNGPDKEILADTLKQCTEAMQAGFGVILVTSGAQSLGTAVLTKLGHTDEASSKQTYSPKMAAAFGQPILMAFYREQAELLGVQISQVLVGASDLRSSSRMRAISKVIVDSIEAGIIPIVNGNDPADDQKTNNDLVAAGIAVMTNATHLLLLTDVAGVYLEPTDSEPVDELHVDQVNLVRSNNKGTGTGGILSKIRAAEITSWNGVIARIASASDYNAIRSVCQGRSVGTLICTDRTLTDKTWRADRKLWISGGAISQGEIVINADAESSISASVRSSLFASGIKRVKGDFKAGDVVDVKSPNGRLLARGQVSVSSNLLRLIRASRVDEIAEILLAILNTRVDGKSLNRRLLARGQVSVSSNLLRLIRASRVDEVIGNLFAKRKTRATEKSSSQNRKDSPVTTEIRVDSAVREYSLYSRVVQESVLKEIVSLFPDYAASALVEGTCSGMSPDTYIRLVNALSVISSNSLVVFPRTR